VEDQALSIKSNRLPTTSANTCIPKAEPEHKITHWNLAQVQPLEITNEAIVLTFKNYIAIIRKIKVKIKTVEMLLIIIQISSQQELSNLKEITATSNIKHKSPHPTVILITIFLFLVRCDLL
jgi:hypothetical protein